MHSHNSANSVNTWKVSIILPCIWTHFPLIAILRHDTWKVISAYYFPVFFIHMSRHYRIDHKKTKQFLIQSSVTNRHESKLQEVVQLVVRELDGNSMEEVI